MKIENVSFESEGQRIAAILHLPDQTKPPCVIASHGLLASKDSDKYVFLGERLTQEGIAFLRFDFRGCGESDGKIEENTITGRIADLDAAINFIRSYRGLKKRIGLLGSSLGGYVLLIKASRDQEIRTSAVWSTPFHLDGLKAKMGTEEIPLLGEAFFTDLLNYRLQPLLRSVTNCLVIHGDKDELVPVDQGWEIFQLLGSPKEIRIIEGADHRLTHTDHRQRATDLSVAWFKKFL